MRLRTVRPRLVVVTGAGSGIGRATAERFAKMGAHVVVSDIDFKLAGATVAAIRQRGYSASPAELDVSDWSRWESFAQEVKAEYGVADVLVNNAGIAMAGPFLKLDPQDWQKLLGINLMGAIYGSRVFGAQMVNRRCGHIVNIASSAAFSPAPMMVPYSVSKAAVKMLTECLWVEFGAKGVGVSVICPGFINTDFGMNGIAVGVDEAAMKRRQDAALRVQEFTQKLPFPVMSPDLVARAVVRAVKFNLVVVPVRVEAWLAYIAQRVAPGVTRLITRPLLTRAAAPLEGRS